MPVFKKAALTLLFLSGAITSASAQTPLPDAIAAPGEKIVTTLHAEGAQIYECKADASGKLAWAFREPIATLLAEGKTVGRHYAGPNWEYSDGSAVTGKVIASAPGTSSYDIPWLRLDVIAHRGTGVFGPVTAVQRINTHGGNLTGSCEKPGGFFSAPYSADYVFLQKT